MSFWGWVLVGFVFVVLFLAFAVIESVGVEVADKGTDLIQSRLEKLNHALKDSKWYWIFRACLLLAMLALLCFIGWGGLRINQLLVGQALTQLSVAGWTSADHQLDQAFARHRYLV